MRVFFVYITAPDIGVARSIADVLVSERLCACANIFDGMESRYWWQGKVESARECAMVVKTTEQAYPALEKRICELHPYETPCIVKLPIEGGAAPFLHWIVDETRS